MKKVKNTEFGKGFMRSQKDRDMKVLLSTEKKLEFLIFTMIPKLNP